MILACGLLVAAGTAVSSDQVDALVWPTASAPKGWFPEQAAAAPSPGQWSHDSFGVAFSGGGTRSASATLGQLRALKALGWFDRLRYVSSVSGGTWGSLPFTYLPSAFDEQVYLGPLKAPQDLTNTDFGAAPPYSFASVIAGSRLVGEVFKGWASGQGDETYAGALGRAFLAPFGLMDPVRGFAWSQQHAQAIAQRNGGCAPVGVREADDVPARHNCSLHEEEHGKADTPLPADRFLLPRPGRPFHIVNASVLAERGYLHVKLAPKSMFPLQITPYYSGVGVSDTYGFVGAPGQMNIGGAFVESFAFDTWPPQRVAVPAATDGAQLYRASRHGERGYFTLSDAMAASGAAPQQTTSALGFRNLGLPEFHHWGFNPHTGRIDRPLVHELAHGDGGHVDNLGLGALLERGVRHAIVFANALRPFQAVQRREPGNDERIGRRMMQRDLLSYFDPELNGGLDHLIDGTTDPACGSACALQALYDDFKAKQAAGDPLVHCGAYRIRTNNERFRIADAGPVHICWVYLDRSAQWLKALGPQVDQETRLDLQLGRKDEARFPHYKTFGEDLAELHEVVQLKPAQVAALSQLAAWALCRGAGQIAREFAELALPLQGCPGIPPAP